MPCREVEGLVKSRSMSSAAWRLRWALRDIKAERTKLTPVSPSDLKTLIEMGLVEMRDDAAMLTNEGHQAVDQ